MRWWLVLVSLSLAGCQCGVSPRDEAGVDGGALVDGGLVFDGGAPEDAGVDGGAVDAGPTQVHGTVLIFGDDVVAPVRQRITSLLQISLGRAPEVLPASAVVVGGDAQTQILSFGTTAMTASTILAPELATIAPEGFIVRTGPSGAGRIAAVAGKPATSNAHGNIGVSYGVYEIMERLGFAFLHPLQPTIPPTLGLIELGLFLNEAPRWPVRRVHLHTQHPLELTELLNGWGVTGPDDAAGFDSMLPEWERYQEWLLANRQNGVEWFLLYADSWSAFADGPVRIARLGRLVELSHAWGVNAGLDVPVAFAQQHSYRLLRTSGTEAAERAEIRMRLDFVMQAGFDFIGIEAGTSEFTHPEPARQLAWMNEVTSHLAMRYGKQAFVKVHASTGQTATGYANPWGSGDINFNMLPHYADARLGVLPHTVQHYSLTDPAPTYGNTDFGYMRDFIGHEAGTRPVLWYPETAYWVSFDVDVPLFLPIYAERRLYDLRLLARDEAMSNKKIDGQMFFSSGWEWGYWLNDVITARAAWNPSRTASNDGDAIAQALEPVVRPFGAAGPAVKTWLLDTIAAEQALLIEGRVSNVAPPTIIKRSGQAYLQGSEAWDDVNDLAADARVGPALSTQPAKLGLVEMRNPLHAPPSYTVGVEPLLAAMESTFGQLATRATALKAQIPPYARPLFNDLADASEITSLRAKQVHGLYDYVDRFFDTNQAPRRARLATARAALDSAVQVVARREPNYRVPVARISGWRPNPTAYNYGYLWTVHSLFYWWRDEGKAVDAPVSPCYLNIISPTDVALGEGVATDITSYLGGLLSSTDQRGCLAQPTRELIFPADADNLRTRP